jgi:hypothetical protein
MDNVIEVVAVLRKHSALELQTTLRVRIRRQPASFSGSGKPSTRRLYTVRWRRPLRPSPHIPHESAPHMT